MNSRCDAVMFFGYREREREKKRGGLLLLVLSVGGWLFLGAPPCTYSVHMTMLLYGMPSKMLMFMVAVVAAGLNANDDANSMRAQQKEEQERKRREKKATTAPGKSVSVRFQTKSMKIQFDLYE